jgi:uncharacterized protein YlxW (UPF0749 family)
VRVLTVAVFALAGLIFFTSFNTAKGTDIRTDASLLKLSDLIQERSRNNGELDESNGSLRRDVESLAERDDGSTKAEDAKLAALEDRAGTQKLKGKAVTVTLDDAPPNATAKLPGYPEPQPDYLVIHQQDLQAVVNALWKGGAVAVTIQGQRVVSTTGIRCIGNSVQLQGVPYSQPYRISAVGDVASLTDAIADDAYLQVYRADAVNPDIKVGWDEVVEDKITAPAYDGLTDLQYAHALPSTTGS